MRNNHTSWFRQNWRTHESSFTEVPDLKTPWERRGRTDIDLWRLVRPCPPPSALPWPFVTTRGSPCLRSPEALGCSPGTVKSNTSRGLSSLRRSIADRDSHATSPDNASAPEDRPHERDSPPVTNTKDRHEHRSPGTHRPSPQQARASTHRTSRDVGRLRRWSAHHPVTAFLVIGFASLTR